MRANNLGKEVVILRMQGTNTESVYNYCNGCMYMKAQV